ncbi:tyrosine--tRNA ligase [Flavobacteriaceae bacterium]|nr:tyrosine--tRNA ligase [Flavobacteriaceae bacterium]
MNYKSQFLQILSKKGFLHQATHLEELDELMSKEKITAYIGFDCTAKSLHVGSLMQITILRILQKCGHQPLVLIGNGTTKVGDPSGKDKERQLLDSQQIQKNADGIKKTLEKFDLSNENSNFKPFKFIQNSDWLESLNYIDFLRDFGKSFSVNKMLTMDSVKLRLERQQSLSFLEFNYMILQSYDFFILNRDYHCQLQIGGSDQWGNIIQGVDLVRRKTQKSSFGLTTTLLTNAQGKKMGKTENGAVWLDSEMLSPFDYFQYFRNIADEDVQKFLNLFVEDDFAVDDFKNINLAKEKLAFEVTKICHGEQGAKNALQKAQEIFIKKNNNSFTKKEVFFTEAEIKKGVSLVEVIFQCKIFESKAEGKRQIKGNAVRVNGEKISDIGFLIKEKKFDLQIGKKILYHNFIKINNHISINRFYISNLYVW